MLCGEREPRRHAGLELGDFDAFQDRIVLMNEDFEIATVSDHGIDHLTASSGWNGRCSMAKAACMVANRSDADVMEIRAAFT